MDPRVLGVLEAAPQQPIVQTLGKGYTGGTKERRGLEPDPGIRMPQDYLVDVPDDVR